MSAQPNVRNGPRQSLAANVRNGSEADISVGLNERPFTGWAEPPDNDRDGRKAASSGLAEKWLVRRFLVRGIGVRFSAKLGDGINTTIAPDGAWKLVSHKYRKPLDLAV